jgi:DNA-binding Xre family transcriptional regulator
MDISYNKLWKLLIDRGIKKTELVKLSGITSNAMAKMGRN